MSDNHKTWNAAYDARPTNPLCEREIHVSAVAHRCVYVNNYRIAGGKPYVSEALPSTDFKTTVRQVLDAFSEDEILAYLAERRERNAYCAGARAYREAANREAS